MADIYTVTETGCWTWMGPLTPDGYASSGRAPHYSVHRAFYLEHRGPIPRRMVLDHLCHTTDISCVGGRDCEHRRCVNPDHLEATTQSENIKRKMARNK